MEDKQFYKISEAMRSALKKPMGDLIKDDRVSKTILEEKVFSKKAAGIFIVSIGDRTTERLSEFGLDPDLEILDSVERRSPRSLVPWRGSEIEVLRARNPAGGISLDALRALKQCSSLLIEEPTKRLRIVIDGEEDLLTLPVIAFLPGRLIALYGQPGEGLVIADSQYSRESCLSYMREIGVTSL